MSPGRAPTKAVGAGRGRPGADLDDADRAKGRDLHGVAQGDAGIRRRVVDLERGAHDLGLDAQPVGDDPQPAVDDAGPVAAGAAGVVVLREGLIEVAVEAGDVFVLPLDAAGDGVVDDDAAVVAQQLLLPRRMKAQKRERERLLAHQRIARRGAVAGRACPDGPLAETSNAEEMMWPRIAP